MSDTLKSLLETSDVKAFCKVFKECETAFGEPSALLRAEAELLLPQFYENYYGDNVPHGFLGLSAAQTSLEYFPSDRKWWPAAQQTWTFVSHKKRVPLNLDRSDQFSGSADDALREGDLSEIIACLQPDQSGGIDRDASEAVLVAALRDSDQGGLKFIFTAQAFRLAGIWNNSPHCFLPALHYLVYGSKDFRVSETVLQMSGQPGAELSGGDQLKPADYLAAESALLGPSPDSAASAVLKMLQKRLSFEAIGDALVLAAAQALLNSQAGLWVWPARALLHAYLVGRSAPILSDRARLEALLTSAYLLRAASERSREGEKNREVGDLSRALLATDAVNTLRSVVSHSDGYAAVHAVQSILSMGEEASAELFGNLATLAAKNDGRIGKGYDLMVVEACGNAFRSVHPELRDKLPAAVAFFLARLFKNYNFFAAYGV